MQDSPDNVEGLAPHADDQNPERQGPDSPGPADAPTPDKAHDEQGPSGPPPEALPGGGAEGPNPQQN